MGSSESRSTSLEVLSSLSKVQNTSFLFICPYFSRRFFMRCSLSNPICYNLFIILDEIRVAFAGGLLHLVHVLFTSCMFLYHLPPICHLHVQELALVSSYGHDVRSARSGRHCYRFWQPRHGFCNALYASKEHAPCATLLSKQIMFRSDLSISGAVALGGCK